MTIRANSLLILTAMLLSVLSQVHGQQQTDPIRLIVRGDDMGFSHAANKAIIECYERGIMTTVEVMPVTPWFPEVVALCNEHPDLDVGIHLALTSEWINIKWRPLTAAQSLTDKNGYFYPMIWPNDNYGDNQALAKQPWKLAEIEREIRAQIELAVKNIPQVSHVSSHMGFTNMAPEVQSLVRRLAKEYKIDIDLGEHNVQYVGLRGPKSTPQEKIASFISLLYSLKPGNTYMFLEHPAYDIPEVQAIHHIGYENVATDRQGVTEMWTDRKVKAAIKALGIELISYASLLEDN
jgi:predicted glycoside hydrolase/deacetylase ChbG (UPF0249 family)